MPQAATLASLLAVSTPAMTFRFTCSACDQLHEGMPAHGHAEPFSWGVWVSLSEASYLQWVHCFDQPQRAHVGPFFGWLNTRLSPYPETAGLKTQVHLRNDGIRPWIELEPTAHPLAVEQRSEQRVAGLR
ncbi:DUF2199 domain-containing protein [Pantoea ananatis]|uniref:DUF2199 domain-containing protein n=1 Tax=Pantoea ananas TaxID=553 RepID=UPI00221EF2F6|nr:DUF2199 domain-containing protein [Pantoea ananatis]